MTRYPTLSFCITCKNRFHQISETLTVNLNDNRQQNYLIEFVLIDFGSTDGLKEWVLENFSQDLKTGYLKYYYTEDLPYWHASIAKNTSHRYATHDIVVNLDCDNYTGLEGGTFIIEQFLRYGEGAIIHQFGSYGDGSFGRIAIYKYLFMYVRGYDESFEPMGYEDADLINRLISIGANYYRIADYRFNKAILNSREDSIRFTGSILSWNEMEEKNKEKSYKSLKSRRFSANQGKSTIGVSVKITNIK